MDYNRARIAAGVAFLACMIAFVIAGGMKPLQKAFDSILNRHLPAATFFIQSIISRQVRDDH